MANKKMLSKNIKKSSNWSNLAYSILSNVEGIERGMDEFGSDGDSQLHQEIDNGLRELENQTERYYDTIYSVKKKRDTMSKRTMLSKSMSKASPYTLDWCGDKLHDALEILSDCFMSNSTASHHSFFDSILQQEYGFNTHTLIQAIRTLWEESRARRMPDYMASAKKSKKLSKNIRKSSPNSKLVDRVAQLIERELPNVSFEGDSMGYEPDIFDWVEGYIYETNQNVDEPWVDVESAEELAEMILDGIYGSHNPSVQTPNGDSIRMITKKLSKSGRFNVENYQRKMPIDLDESEYNTIIGGEDSGSWFTENINGKDFLGSAYYHPNEHKLYHVYYDGNYDEDDVEQFGRLRHAFVYYDDDDYSVSARKSKREVIKARVEELLEEDDDEIAKPRMRDMFLDSRRKAKKSNEEKGEDAEDFFDEEDEESEDSEGVATPEDADEIEECTDKRKKRMSKFSVTTGGSQPYNGRENYNQSPMMREAIDRYKSEKDLVKSLQNRVDEINGARRNTDVNNKSPLRIIGRH